MINDCHADHWFTVEPDDKLFPWQRILGGAATWCMFATHTYHYVASNVRSWTRLLPRQYSILAA